MESDGFASSGMDKFQAVGMEVEAVGEVAVELVAEDGAAQTVGVGTVHAQLVGAPCLRIEGDAVVADDLVVGDGWLAALVVDDLARTVDGVAE